MNEENIDKALLGFDDESESPELAGLGTAIGMKFAAVQRAAINKFAAVKTKTAIIKSNMTKGQALLTAQSSNLDMETRKNWAAGKIMFTDVVKYIRKDVTGLAGMVDVFVDSITKEVGITNISKARFEDGENMMLERIELEYAKFLTPGAGIVAVKVGQYAPIVNTDDSALINGELEVIIGGKSFLRIPVSSICEPKKYVVGSLANGFNFKAPKLIKEKEEIQVRIHFAGTMVAGVGNTQAINVKLIGDSTKLR